MRLLVPSLAGISLAAIPQVIFACSISSPVSTTDLVRDADVIVRAQAVEYARPPADPNVWTNGAPDSRVRFRILEVVRGPALPALELPGYLSEVDDFNDHEAPYTFVRPNGRSGSCFANTYRSGATFLLMLKASSSGGYTVNWYALGPVNEQLHSDRDPWLLWVRQESSRPKLPNIRLQPAAAGGVLSRRG